MWAAPTDIRNLVDTTHREFGKIDILVNNAATNIAQEPVLQVDEAKFDKMIEVNLKSAFRFIQAVAPGMCQRGSGSIINIASIAGLRPQFHGMLYSMTKAALIMMTQSYALELGPQGVRVNAIAPGLVQTVLSEYFWKDEEKLRQVIDEQPIKHLGQPHEIAEVALLRGQRPRSELRWNKDLPMLRTRRRLLQAATTWPAFHALQAARKEFWESKDPADWSNEEKRILLGQSPWAREGIVRFEVERKRARAPDPTRAWRDREEVFPAPIRAPHPGPSRVCRSVSVRRRFQAPTRASPCSSGCSRAGKAPKPVRLAGGPEMPEGTARFYVIRLQGMPLLPPPKGRDGESVPNPNQRHARGH